jgi:5-enolpyruvylshikimate-3-phosphate synthase
MCRRKNFKKYGERFLFETLPIEASLNLLLKEVKSTTSLNDQYLTSAMLLMCLKEKLR